MIANHDRVLPDEYVRPRYPVDEPPTYRQRCACGWIGPERYADVDVKDHARHVITAIALYGPTTHEDTDVRPVSPDDDTKAAEAT